MKEKDMLEFLGNRRHELMKLLVRSKTGLTVEKLPEPVDHA
jgi:hypothetical protein